MTSYVPVHVQKIHHAESVNMSDSKLNKVTKEEFPPLKRKKISQDEVEKNKRDDWNCILSADVLERTEHFAASYKKSEPYPHGVISNICVDGFLGTSLDSK